ncbi:MAG: hypothetical protein LBB98_02340 [Treponema sp.]|nr:hypothetical protein [Treponema sp.]
MAARNRRLQPGRHLEFAEEDRGKTVYIALRQQNEKGSKGPSSEIQSTAIP